jgi:hypothetical protein
MKLSNNLFDLSKEQIETSKMMYEGKIIKCLVAPYHTERNLEIDWAPNIFMFPEKEFTQLQTRQFVSMLVNSKFDEILVITTDINIILDMVDTSVRILTEFDTIVPSPEKTFMANQHTIIYCLLNNQDHQKSANDKQKAKDDINKVIERINKSKGFDKSEYDEILNFINMIGEPLISGSLKQMLNIKRNF